MNWTNADPSSLPVGAKQKDESDEDCNRCGKSVGLDGAKLCEQCHTEVKIAQYL